MDRVSLYEVKALEGGRDAGGAWLDAKGTYDLSLLDELDVLMFCKAIWEGCATRLRESLRDNEAPF
ncbi:MULTISPECIES: hypothetical protein [unclassified Sinorhizobium]|uniref:hypothetical protein n=1 Tax=unclassified Sinorhizobium TaxID=2613772 RepID=UPI003526338C